MRVQELPLGWIDASLVDIATVIMGQSPPGSTYNSDARGLPFFQGKADFGDDHPTPRTWCTAPTRIAEPGDVLISVRAPVGPTNIADQRCAIGRGLAAVRARGGVPPELIRFAIQRQEAEIASWGTGSTFTAISKRHFKDIRVAVPPVDQRDEIVSMLLRSVMLRRSAVSHLARTRVLLGRFRQSVLAAACSPRAIASSDEWETAPLGTLLKTLDQGWSPQCLNRPKGDAAEWAVIKTTAIQALEFKAAENKALPTTLKSRPNLSIEPGDLLITRAGPRTRVGISCLVRKCPPQLMLCDKAYRMRVDPSKVLDEYLELVLNSPQVLNVIESMKTGTSDSGMNLTQKGLLTMAVSLPRLGEQRRIVELTRDLLRQSGHIASAIGAANMALDHVVSSTLDKTFRGSPQTG